jgi:membrane protein implicated in regulation of membrane protease activity
MTATDILWLVAFIFFLAVEAGTVSLTSVWFAVGSLAAMIISLLNGQLWLQITVFLTVSVILLLCLRPLVRKYVTPRIVRTNVDSVLEQQGIVTSQVDNLNAQGEVTINGMTWTARSTDGQPIPEGTVVRVDRIEGVKAFVTPVAVEETV